MSQGVFLASGSGCLEEGWTIVLSLAIEPTAKKPLVELYIFQLFSLKWKKMMSFPFGEKRKHMGFFLFNKK